VFAARGNSPFQLAYGNSAAKTTALAIEAVIPGYRSDAPFKVEPAALGDPVTLAGPGRLRQAVDYKKWVLWGILNLRRDGARLYDISSCPASISSSAPISLE